MWAKLLVKECSASYGYTWVSSALAELQLILTKPWLCMCVYYGLGVCVCVMVKISSLSLKITGNERAER